MLDLEVIDDPATAVVALDPVRARLLAELVERAAFSSELTHAITNLVARYHDAPAHGGCAHRLVVVAHPLPGKTR